MQPLKMKIIRDDQLEIRWDNNSVSNLDLNKLRKLCPCATCCVEREKESKKHFKVFTGKQVSVANIKTIGNYAIEIKWKDGHKTGIYEYSFLYNLTEEENNPVDK